MEASLQDGDSIARAIEGSDYVVHMATPTTGKTAQDYIAPAVDGTLAVMHACN